MESGSKTFRALESAFSLPQIRVRYLYTFGESVFTNSKRVGGLWRFGETSAKRVGNLWRSGDFVSATAKHVKGL